MKNEKKYIMLTLEEDFKNELFEEAKAKGLSLSTYIRMILLERRREKNE